MANIPLVFTYPNHRGHTAQRRIIPAGMVFAATEWHPTMQWLMRGFDLDRNADRDFAVADIIAFAPISAGGE